MGKDCGGDTNVDVWHGRAVGLATPPDRAAAMLREHAPDAADALVAEPA
ncbi:MAG TPA: hypothetical protein VIW70_15020 [Rubrivivax sp.]